MRRSMMQHLLANITNNTHVSSISQQTATSVGQFTYRVVNILVATSIVLINGLVFLLIRNHHELRRTVSNRIVLSLVISDLLTGVCMILHIASSLKYFMHPTTPFAFAYRISVEILTLWLHVVTMSNLCLIIAERFLALSFPYKIQTYINRNRVNFALFVIWFLTLLYPCIQLFWVYKALDGHITEEEYKYITNAEIIFSSFSIVVLVIVPVVSLFAVFVKMFREIKKFPTIDKTTRQKEERRVLIIFTIMYALFILFALPYFLIRFVMDLHVKGVIITRQVLQFVYLLKYFPPLLNPFVYVFNKPDFKRVIRKITERLSKRIVSISELQKPFSNGRRPSDEQKTAENRLLNSNDVNNNKERNMET